MRTVVAVTALCLAVIPAQARSLIQCRGGSGEVIVSLQDHKAFGHMLSCIIRSDFVADMTPCAPNGGFGLSAPTGSASLVRVVTRWQDYADHSGGVVGFAENAATIGFSGGFHISGNYELDWQFDIDRLTGRGVLKQKDKASETFQCAATKARL